MHDLNKFPYPFPDNYADYILMEHVLEHLDDVVEVMNECWRILKKEGLLEVIVPYYKSKNAFTDPTHKHFFTEKSMMYFTEEYPLDFYTVKKWKIIDFKKQRTGFPYWHLKKYFSLDIKFLTYIPPYHELRWLLKPIKNP